MNITGEYSVNYNIYTMFNIYPVKIKNYNLITDDGYEFFLEKWYKDDKIYPIQLGYLHNGDFFKEKTIDDKYTDKLSYDGTYSSSTIFVDKDTYKQYKYNEEEFVEFNELLDKICLGDYYQNDMSKPSESDIELYSPVKEYKIEGDGFIRGGSKLIMKMEIEREELNGTTEIGIKTNHGRLVSHDIHPPYNLPFGSNMTIEYVFKLKKEE